jgi:alkanesulfonate monooxygenase SsuD/methylene tetrahydromethanopterin reductase-like flavin-dependent oxidoreductase (luciferase family)
MPELSLRFDLRDAGLGPPLTDLYREAAAMARYADEHLVVDRVQVSEHHACEDGYCPSPLVLLAGLATATERCRLMTAAVILSLHDPVRLAEDIAVADLVSGGRLDVVLAAGYRPAEFAMFGRDFDDRPAAMERGVAVLRQAWTGEPFEHDGRPATVTPRPAQRPGPPLILAGSGPAAARRAARLGDGFMPGLPDPGLIAAYEAERSRLGRPRGRVVDPAAPMGVLVVEDPDRGWHEAGRHLLHEARTYGEWENDRPGANPYPLVDDPAALRELGVFAVVTPDECVALWDGLGAEAALLLHPLVGGLDPEVGWQSLELFASKVLPRLRRDDPLL